VADARVEHVEDPEPVGFLGRGGDAHVRDLHPVELGHGGGHARLTGIPRMVRSDRARVEPGVGDGIRQLRRCPEDATEVGAAEGEIAVRRRDRDFEVADGEVG